MLFNISIKNIKKSLKDYSIYFFTLVFAVAMFYMFNSLDAQNSMLQLSKSKYEIAQSLVGLIGYVSVFVSIILGFLIIYSNNFLIKRRKKEIGLYLTLGMSKQKVSIMLFVETVLIGIISLLVGLICGIFLSQFLSIFTAKLFEVNMSNFKFIFSKMALLKTMLYFSVIFVLVIIFNVISLSRYKLIDLITAYKKNEKVKFRNKYVTIISFILSISLIGYAYYLLFHEALVAFNEKTLIMLITGALGTFLLFFSLSGFLLKVVQRCKKIYYKGLNMFLLKQVNNRINTTVISTTIISLMLLLTIGILSGSMSMATAFNQDLATNNLVDFTIDFPISTYEYNEDGKKVLATYEKEDYDKLYSSKEFNNMVKDYVIYEKYIDKNIFVSSMLTPETKERLIKEYGSGISFNYNIPIIKESDYQKMMKIINKEKEIVDVKQNEYLLITNVELILNSYQDFYENKNTIDVNNHTLKPATNKIYETAFENYNTDGNDGILIVSDELTNCLELYDTMIIGNYNKIDDIEKLDDDFYLLLANNFHHYNIRTKVSMENSSLGIKTIITFIGLYLGITFALCSATVLAIGQLSESSDNKERYKVLRQLGADNKMIQKTLFIQIAIAFIFPLIVAVIHSIVGLKELNSIIQIMGHIDLSANILFTTLFILIIYGGYFLATYLCSKIIIKE